MSQPPSSAIDLWEGLRFPSTLARLSEIPFPGSTGRKQHRVWTGMELAPQSELFSRSHSCDPSLSLLCVWKVHCYWLEVPLSWKRNFHLNPQISPFQRKLKSRDAKASIGFNYLHLHTTLSSRPRAGLHKHGGHLDMWLNADSYLLGMGGLEIHTSSKVPGDVMLWISGPHFE